MRFKVIALVDLLCCGAFAAVILSRTPSNDRDWSVHDRYAATTSLDSDGIAHFSELRDFSYIGTTTEIERWIPNATIDSNKIVRAWFIVEPFSAIQAVGHTYLTFEMADGSAYSFSVESRLTRGQSYSMWAGMMRSYELIYMWGTERDFLARRLIYADDIVRMYPLTLKKAQAQELFRQLLARSNDLVAHPRFYNTLTANCTNVLAELANEAEPGAVPYDLSWNLPGWSDYFLMRIGYIKTEGTQEQTRAKHDLSADRSLIARIATTTSPADFGKQVRSLLPPVE